MVVAPRTFLTLGFLSILIAATNAYSRIDLKYGDSVPTISFTTTNNKRINISEQSSFVRVFLFGQNDHKWTQLACEYIANALDDPKLQDVDIEWVFVLSKSGDPLKTQACGSREQKPLLVHDVDRTIFGAFGIITIPSVVVVDEHAHVVHAILSMSPNFGDIVADAVLLAVHKIERDEFELTLHFKATPPSEERLRSQRIMKMAQQAAQHGMDEMAYTQYVKAVEADPSFAVARVALGGYLLQHDNLDEAQKVFEALLELDETNSDGILGLASVLSNRGIEFQEEVHVLITKVLKNDPNNAQAYYMLGELYEAQGDCERAAESYKVATTLLLSEVDTQQKSEK